MLSRASLYRCNIQTTGIAIPTFLMLIEDGNWPSIIVASFLALNETEASFSKMVALFKKHNPQWESVTVIRTVRAEQFPSAQASNLLVPHITVI